MGKVYKFSDIEYKRVPCFKDFQEAKYLALNAVSQLAREGKVYGAKVFGSVGKGTPNERSDFDLLVVSQNAAKLTFPILKEIFDDILVRTKVEIEPLIIAREFAETGQNTVDGLYFKHIESIPDDGNIAGSNPLDVFRPYDSTSTEVHRRYVDSKIRSLSERYFSHSREDKYMVLQRSLEAPVNTGRRTLQVLPYLGCSVEIGDDGKQAVIDAFKNVFIGSELMPGFNYLLESDEKYTAFLRGALKGQVSREEYDLFVNALGENCNLQAIDWESEINKTYRALLEGRHRLQEGNVNFQRRGKESL